jgi:hypothetical protein
MREGPGENPALFISSAREDGAGMTPLLFALALLPAPPEPDQPRTAGQLYDGCVGYAAGLMSSDGGDVGPVMCAAEIAMVQAAQAAEVAMESVDGSQPRTRRFCLPESLLSTKSDTDAPLVQAFIAYVDRNPASRNLDYDEVFQRALVEKWPCPR